MQEKTLDPSWKISCSLQGKVPEKSAKGTSPTIMKSKGTKSDVRTDEDEEELFNPYFATAVMDQVYILFEPPCSQT